MSWVLAEEIGFLLSRASGVVIRATNAALAEHSLRVRSYSVLALACETAGGRSQRDLAAELGLDPSQVVTLVDDLVTAGLVERRAATADRRTKLVAATGTGRAALKQANQAADAAMDQGPLALLRPDERDLLRDMLTRVISAAEENGTLELASRKQPVAPSRPSTR